MTFGPNTTWGSSLRVGGNGRTATGTEMASIVTTDGNIHLDAAASTNGIYLNYYAGTGGTLFGNGAGSTVATMNSSGSLSMNGSIVLSGTVGGNVSQSRDKLRVWNSSTYTIGMMNGYTFGSLGNDYAMSFEMNNSSSRGFWWGDNSHSNAQGSMSLTTDGRLYVAKNITVGQGEAYTTDAIQSSFLNVYGDSATIPAATVYQSNVNGDGLFVNMDSNASADYVLRLQADGGSEDVLYARANGQIGIGTESPNGRLNIIKPGLGGFEFHPENSTDTNLLMHFDRLANADMNIKTRAATHQFLIGPTEKMRLDANGRLKIGSGNASYPLHVDGNVSNVSIYASADIAAFSDARVKDNIITISGAVDKIKAIRGVTYQRTDLDSEKRFMGVIAQEVLPHVPEVVHEDEKGMYSVSYQNMVALLIEGMKEQQDQIDELKEQIKKLSK